MTTKQDEHTPLEVGISLHSMDKAVKSIRDLRDTYAKAKKLSDEAYEHVKRAEAELILMMEKSERSVYIVEGVGRVRISHEMSVQTPKTLDEKKAFFEWLAKNKGQDVADAYMSINSQSLNSLYNELQEEAASRGEILQVDGLGEPIARTKLSLTKA